MQTAGRFISLAFVAVVMSGLVLLTFVPAKRDQLLEILRNDYPQILPPGKSTFSFSVVARERFKRLELRFITLTSKDLTSEDLVDPDETGGATRSPDDVLHNLRKLDWFEKGISRLGISPERFNRSLTLEGRNLDLLVLDYSDAVGSRLGPSLLGKDVALSVPLVFAAIVTETGHQYLEGALGFFANPDINLGTLLISHNENETRYVADDEVREGSDRLPISQAPRGVVRVESVETDDTITVAFGIEPLQFTRDPEGPVALLQIVRVYLDGEPYGYPIVNAVR